MKPSPGWTPASTSSAAAKVETLPKDHHYDYADFITALKSAGFSDTDLDKDEAAVLNCCDGRTDYGKFSIPQTRVFPGT